MARKPWPIVILAMFHFLEPVFKILFYSLLWDMPVSRFLTYMQYQSSFGELFLFLGAFPIAGFAILSVKKWSIPTFFLVQVITVAGHIYYHRVAPKAFPISLIVSVTVANLAVVTYFLMPAVRIAYLDPRVRWWEAKPRYLVNLSAKAIQGKKSTEGNISNISEGGIFLTCTGKAALAVEEPITLQFDFLNLAMTVTGRIRHFSTGSGAHKYGIQFSDLTREQKTNMRRCIAVLGTLDYERQGGNEDAVESLKTWVRTLVKTGRGLMPEVKSLPAKKTQVSVGSDTATSDKSVAA